MNMASNGTKSEERFTAKTICVTALTMALICIATMFIQIPIPLGYAHLGNTFILLTACFFGSKIGMISAGVGSAFADFLTGYSMWIIPTLIIKVLMGLIIGKMSHSEKKPFKMLSVRVLMAALISNIWMVIGYTFSGAILYGSVAAGFASSPGLIAEGIVNIIIFYVAGIAIERSKLLSFL